MTVIPYVKMTGTGNDFVLVDALRTPRRAAGRWSSLAQTMCDPRHGVGADGLLVLEPSKRADVRMRIFNADGSEASMCGNGVRCLGFYAFGTGAVKNGLRRMTNRIDVETKAGVKSTEILSANRVKVMMGAPSFLRRVPHLTIKGRRLTDLYLVDSGVPHLVCWVDDVAEVDVQGLGQRLRSHPQFQPQGTNVDFVEMQGADERFLRGMNLTIHHYRVKMRTYERGVEGETRACGTGAVAVAAAVAYRHPFRPAVHHSRQGRFRAVVQEQFLVDLTMPGGILQVELYAHLAWDPARNQILFGPTYLEGDVKVLSRGTWNWNWNGKDHI